MIRFLEQRRKTISKVYLRYIDVNGEMEIVPAIRIMPIEIAEDVTELHTNAVFDTIHAFVSADKAKHESIFGEIAIGVINESSVAFILEDTIYVCGKSIINESTITKTRIYATVNTRDVCSKIPITIRHNIMGQFLLSYPVSIYSMSNIFGVISMECMYNLCYSSVDVIGLMNHDPVKEYVIFSTPEVHVIKPKEELRVHHKFKNFKVSSVFPTTRYTYEKNDANGYTFDITSSMYRTDDGTIIIGG